MELEVEETGSFAVVSDLAVPRGRENLCVRAFERLHPADDFTFSIRSRFPCRAGWAPAPRHRGGPDGGRSPVRARRDLLALATELEAIRQRRRRAARRLRHLRGRRRRPVCASERPGALAWCPCRRCAPSRRAGAAAEYRWSSRVQRRHGALLTLGWPAGLDLLAGPAGRAAPAAPLSSVPRSYELAMRAGELGALGATISGAGPTVLVWCQYEQTARWPLRLSPTSRGGRACCARASSRREPTSRSCEPGL